MLCMPARAMSGRIAFHRPTEETEIRLGGQQNTFAELRAPAAQPPSRPALLARPTNYAPIQEGHWYRSGFPDEDNVDFLESLDIQSIVTLVDSPPSDALLSYVKQRKIDHKHIILAANKDGKVKTTNETLCEALAYILNPANFPVYIHCNHGKHRTGCVVGCLRKIQGWSLEDTLAEYESYASPKARSGDIELITKFDPECLISHSRMTKDFEWVQSGIREAQDVFALAQRCGSSRDTVLVADTATSKAVGA